MGWVAHMMVNKQACVVQQWNILQCCFMASLLHYIAVLPAGPKVREAIRSFLERWPTPSAVLDAPQEQ